ncbi:MAG TPA: hypothetical protein VIR63_05190 [Pontiella sp.]
MPLFNNSTMCHTSAILLLASLTFILNGCTSLRTDKSHYANIQPLLAQADYPAVIARIEGAKQKAYTYKDRVVYYLDIGMLHHWNGDYEKSNEFLEKAERSIEENFTKSITRAAASLLINDNTLAYAGEDYEDIYLNAFKALNYLALNQPDSAFVEVRRINNKLALLESKHAKMAKSLSVAEEAQETFSPGKNYFVESALGRYLSALLYRNDHKWDDVRIDFEKIEQGWKLQPDIYPFSSPDFSRSRKEVGNGIARLNIIAFSGLAPEKQATSFYVHTEENLIVLAGSSEDYLGRQNLSDFQTIFWPNVSAGYHFKFQLPQMKRKTSQVGRIEIEVNGVQTETLQKLESLENAAVETFSIKKPMIYLKTLTRAVSKGITAEQAKQKMTKDMGEGAALFTRLAADLLVDQTENADLRTSRFFPAEASIRELHLEDGVYDISINFFSHNGTLLHSDTKAGVHIEAGKLNVLESAYLD